MKIKNSIMGLFMIMVLCFSALPAFGVDPAGSFWVSEYYVVEKKVDGVVHEFMSPANNYASDKCGISVDGTLAWFDINQTKTINGVELKFLEFLTLHNGDGSITYPCLIQPTGTVQDVDMGCDEEAYYEENEGFVFNGVLLEIKNIDVLDRQIVLKFLESGITYNLDIGDEIERDNVYIKFIGIVRSAEPTAKLCLRATGSGPVLEPVPPFKMAVDDTAPASDVIIVTDVLTGLRYEGYDTGSVPYTKLFSEVNALMLDNMVTLAVYHGEAVIIVGDSSPASHNMFANDLVQVLMDQGRISSHRVILSSEVPSSRLIDLFVEPEPELVCTESDAVSYLDVPGIHYYIKGTACIGDGTIETCRTDYCSGDNVVEFYLEEGECTPYTDIFSKTHLCPNGCTNGKCYYPGYYLDFNKDKYYSGDVIEFEIRAADSGTANIHLYIMPYDTDEKVLVKPNLLVQGTKTVEIDTSRYGNIFDSTGDYLFLVTDATTDGVGGGIGTNSRATEFVNTAEPDDVPVCTDSDGGRNEFVRGTTRGTTACTVQENCNNLVSSTDSCNGNTLNEYVCDVDPRYGVERRYVNFIYCEHGCSNGACIREVQQNEHQIKYITGAKSQYAPKEAISMKVKALEGDGSIATRSEGWNVQYYTYDSRNTDNYIQEYARAGKYNAVFDGTYWNIDYWAPEDEGKYYTEVVFYCSSTDSKCMREVGHDYEDEVRKKLYFSVDDDLSGAAKPDLVIKNLQFVRKSSDLSTIEFDIYNAGGASTGGKFAIAVYVDGRIQTHTLVYESIAPGQKVHKELSNYKWLSSATFNRAVTVVLDRFVGSEEDNPLYEGFYDNMIAESSDYNNKAELTVIGTQGEVPVYNRYTLADYPELYISHGRFNGYIVVGDRAPASDVVAAVDIATGIQYAGETVRTTTGFAVNKIEVGAAKLASEIANPLMMNIISVGNACNNAVTDELKGNPEPCRKGLTEGEGMIMLYQYNGKSQIVVDGYSDQDVRKAARVLSDYDAHDLRGTCMVIRGDFNYPKAYPCKEPVAVVPEEPAEPEPHVIVVPGADGECGAGSCPVDSTCVALGIRLVDGGTPSYCDFDGSMKAQKGDGNSCQNDYECLSNSCGNGVCQDFGARLGELEQEMRETRGMLNRLISWIRSWFGGGDDYEEEPEVVDEEEFEVPEGASPVIEEDFGVLTYKSTNTNNFCDFVHDTSCELYTAEYRYGSKSARIVAGVEVHPAEFTNHEAIEGINGEFAREGYTTQRESYGGNSIYLFTGGQYPNHQYIAAWYSGKNVVAIYVDNSPAVLTDAELDDVFEDSLLKYYLARYPSNLRFE